MARPGTIDASRETSSCEGGPADRAGLDWRFFCGRCMDSSDGTMIAGLIAGWVGPAGGGHLA